MLVDGDADQLDLLSRRLSGQGFSVEVAQDGTAAYEKICRSHYDLVLLDQRMSGSSGPDLLQLLRATYSPSELPVIMVAAEDQGPTAAAALDQGANDYVVKPVDMPVVTARIQAQLSRSRADRRLKLSDPLTGLGNRLQLLDRLGGLIAEQRLAGNVQVAVFLLDLDSFKTVNDSFGHATGDQLLIEAGARLGKVIAERGLSNVSTVARLGGDEFVVLVERCESSDQLQELAGAILACLARPFSMERLWFPITASVGVAMETDGQATPETLLRDADLAMYRAKELGKNRWQMFDPGLRERAQARMAIAIDLREAAERGELMAVYQPKVNLATRAIAGFEALLRWRHPQRGVLKPSEFIPVAEETGLIIPIGEWILFEACRQLKSWQAKFPASPPLSMNVNLSVKQLVDPNLVHRVKGILVETGIAPETLKLELTESSLMTEIESAEGVLAGLRSLKVGLKLDDFGTGYSSLSYLRGLHFDSLKIDMSFVHRIEPASSGVAIVETIVNLAHTLHMSVVAEGIENEYQLAELTRLGCEMGQGFYFSPPLEAEGAERLLAANERK